MIKQASKNFANDWQEGQSCGRALVYKVSFILTGVRAVTLLCKNIISFMSQ